MASNPKYDANAILRRIWEEKDAHTRRALLVQEEEACVYADWLAIPLEDRMILYTEMFHNRLVQLEAASDNELDMIHLELVLRRMTYVLQNRLEVAAIKSRKRSKRR